jgi:hypothetical protein
MEVEKLRDQQRLGPLQEELVRIIEEFATVQGNGKQITYEAEEKSES